MFFRFFKITNRNEITCVLVRVRSQIILRSGCDKIPHCDWAMAPSSIFVCVFLNLASAVMQCHDAVTAHVLPVLKIFIHVVCIQICC